MYSNIYGQEGVEKVIELLKTEVISDAGNLGISDVQALRGKTSYVRPVLNLLEILAFADIDIVELDSTKELCWIQLDPASLPLDY